MFYVRDYVRDILQRRLAFIQQFTRDDNLLSFKDVVEEWLGIPETLEVLSVTDIDTATNSLFDLLEKNANQSLAEDDFKFIRRAILTEAKKQNIKYIRCIDIVEQTKKRLKANSNYDMSIDNILFNMTFIMHN